VILGIKPLNSFFGGGRVLTVYGQHFSTDSNAHLIVYDENGVASFETKCNIQTSRLMECISPSIKKVLGEGFAKQKAIDLNIGLKIDNVTSLLRLFKPYSERNFAIHYVEDPEYQNFTENFKVYNGDLLVIEGDRLNEASDDNDVRVTIGEEFCNVTALTSTQLLCFPPVHQPPSKEESSLAEVTVHVGSTLHYHIGYIQYNMEEEDLISSEVIGYLPIKAISAITAVLSTIFRYFSNYF